MILPGTLLWVQEELSVSFLIESGANDFFLDERLARQAGLPLETLPEAKMVLNLDGRVIVRVTHRTVPVDLLVSDNHLENSTVPDSIVLSPCNPRFSLTRRFRFCLKEGWFTAALHRLPGLK